MRLRSTLPRSEITHLQLWEQACYQVTHTLALMIHTTISDWCKGLLDTGYNDRMELQGERGVHSNPSNPPLHTGLQLL